MCVCVCAETPDTERYEASECVCVCVSQAFTIMDQNRDGFICKNDLRDTYAALGKPSFMCMCVCVRVCVCVCVCVCMT